MVRLVVARSRVSLIIINFLNRKPMRRWACLGVGFEDMRTVTR